MQFGISSKFFHKSVLLGASLLLASMSGRAQEQAPHSTVVPDAQIEANVLKALAGATQLSDQKITTTTVYGEVTLSGVVKDEPTRQLAETLTSRAAGVKKVIDELTLSSDSASSAAANSSAAGNQPQDGDVAGTNPNLQSGGSMAPPQGAPQHAPPPPDMVQNPQSGAGPNYGPGAPEYRQPYPQGAPYPGAPYPGPQSGQYPPQYSGPQGGQYPPQYPGPQGGQYPAPYPGQQGAQGGYPAPPPSSYAARPEPYGAQQAGQAVTVPSGALLRIRINQGLSSKKAKVGETFDAIVLNDVVADGEVAIPRGATVQGSVVEAKKSRALGGHAELTLQLTQVTLAGKVFPLVSDSWTNVGPDKTGRTVNNTVGLGALGAIIGAVAGGGPGAAIGAGAGAAAGLGTSAASNGGQAIVPPEAILTFHLTQPAPVTTVSQAEMDRLSYGVPAGAQPAMARRPGYYGPGYYPRPTYNPYPY